MPRCISQCLWMRDKEGLLYCKTCSRVYLEPKPIAKPETIKEKVIKFIKGEK